MSSLKQRWRASATQALVGLLLAAFASAGWGAGAARPVPPPPPISELGQPSQPPKLEPPDGKWLKDEQGREYFLYETKRYEGFYRWENEEHTKVRLAYGLIFDVASADKDKFVLKVYKPADPADTPVTRRRVVTDEDRSRIAESYKVDVASSARLALTAFSRGLPTRGQWRNGVAVADINMDGKLDIVHGPFRKGGSTPRIFLGNAKGDWRPWDAQFPAIPFDYGDAAVGDLNGDRRPDLVLGSHLLGLVAMIGDGKGAFRAWSDGIEFRRPGEGSADTPPFTSHALAVGDMNGDGRPDIVALGEGPRLAITRDVNRTAYGRGSRGIRIYFNQGNGTWRMEHELGDQLYGDVARIADLDGDGRLDLVTGSRVQGLNAVVHLNTGDGHLKTAPLAALRPSEIVNSVAVADFNGDRRPDLVLGYQTAEAGVWRSGIDVYTADPRASAPAGAAPEYSRRPLFNEESVAPVQSMDSGDLDGDGSPDIVASLTDGRVLIFLGDGKGWFTREEVAGVGLPGCGGFETRIADLDKDRRGDLVLGFAGEAGTSEVMRGALGRDNTAACPSEGALQAWKSVKR